MLPFPISSLFKGLCWCIVFHPFRKIKSVYNNEHPTYSSLSWSPSPSVVPQAPYLIVLQVQDPPPQSSNTTQPTTPFLSQSHATHILANTSNIHISMIDTFLSVWFKDQSLERDKMTMYWQMLANKWNSICIINDETNDSYWSWLLCYGISGSPASIIRSNL